ncbi:MULTISPECIES: hypothetical protein [unclassified Gluconobacter]|uniref:hypothetical protein n=1 Tax=unclassified Gluconobacter TaxID=2644261 RepID=UPI001C0559A6|nr:MULTISPECIES: hypothetical protein [unclassified Gluconobacter]
MRLILASLAVVILAGCTRKPQLHETAACINYRSMMTAPMPSDAMQRLQEKCAASRDKLGA